METATALELVSHALESGCVAHGYLIVGGLRGEAMRLTMQILSRLFGPETGQRVHPDIHWVHPEKKSRIISVESVHVRLLEPLASTSFAGGWKVGILVGADCLHEVAANAILKILEEPPSHTLFFLLTEKPEALLPTIVSRCQRIDLPDARARDLAEPWKKRLLDALGDEALTSLTGRSAVAGDIAVILAELKEKAEELVLQEDDEASAGGGDGAQADKAILEARISARYREFRGEVLMVMMGWFRDLMALVVSSDKAIPLMHEARRRQLEQCAAHLTAADAFRNIEALESLARSLNANLQELPVLSMFMDQAHFGVCAR